MSTVVLSRPIKTGCNFNASNPCIYKLRREDYQFNQINNNGGFAQVQINGVDLSAYFEVGNTLYIEGLATAEVTAIAFSGGNTLITTDIAFIATSTGFINNNSKRTDYKIEAEIFDFATNESLGPRIVQDPSEAGEVMVDVSGIVKTFLSANWEMPAVNEVESETSKKVYIKYQEFYDVTYWTLVNDVASPVVLVFAYMQLLQNSPPDFSRYLHGGNMLSFYPEDDTKIWLTRFVIPSMWRDWPFTLSFIWNIAEINRRVKQYDSEGNELSNTATELEPDVDKVHRMTVGDVDPLATRLLITLEDGAGSGTPEQIISELEVTVKDPCDSQILLYWKNSRGGDAFWMFDESQDYQYTYPSGRKVTRMTLFSDNLRIGEWDAINELNSPTEVIALNIVDYGMDDSIDKTHFRNDNQVFIVNQDLSKVGVIVIPTDNKTKTSYKKHSIEITIELPELFPV